MVNDLGVKTVVSLLTKPPANDHSCWSLVRTNTNFSGVDATESSPYKVKDARILLRQGWEVVVVGSSSGREPNMTSPRLGGPADALEWFTGLLNWEEGGFVALR